MWLTICKELQGWRFDLIKLGERHNSKYPDSRPYDSENIPLRPSLIEICSALRLLYPPDRVGGWFRFPEYSRNAMLRAVAEWAIEVLNQTVEAELLALPKDMQARFLRISELLEGFGPQHVGMPHVRPLGEKLWEMRLMGSAGIGRAIYTAASGRRLIVLHAFVKKTQKTPQRAIDAARRRIREITP